MSFLGNTKSLIEQLEAKNTELEAAFTSLSAEHEAAKSKIATLEASLLKAGASITQMSASLSSLSAKVDAIEKSVSAAVVQAQAQAPAIASQIMASFGVAPIPEGSGGTGDPYASMDRKQLLAEWKKITDLNAKNDFFRKYLAESSAHRQAASRYF